MTLITLQDGKIVLRDGAIGTEQACCCQKCSGPCDEENPCPEGCECVDGQCVEPPCSGPCDTNEDCDPGCRCDGGECVPCAGIDGGNGWFTANHRADFENFLAAAGYSNPLFTPQQPFVGIEVPLPYTDGCGQTFFRVTYECCGEFGLGNPCDPLFFTQVLRDAGGGGGNQNPPCNLTENEAFLWACCEEVPPP